MIAFSGLMFRGNPGFQLAVILLVLFVCYVLQVKHRPYMSSVERAQVVENFHNKAEDGLSEWHKVLDERIKAQTKKMKGFRGKLQQQKDNLMMKKNTAFFWDYNTVEAVLLAAAVLISLAGVMFESDRFAQRNDVNWQRDLITVCIFLIIFVTNGYYFLVFLSEVMQTTPKWVRNFCMGRKRLKAKEEDTVDIDLEVMMSNPMRKQVFEQGEAIAKKEEEMSALDREMKKKIELAESKNLELVTKLRDANKATKAKIKLTKKQSKKRGKKKAFAQRQVQRQNTATNI
jgi:hypothetical protein